MTKMLKWTAVGLGALFLLLALAVNNNLADLVEAFLPGGGVPTHCVLAALEAGACLWFWRGVAGGRRHLSFSDASGPEDRERLARELARRLRANPLLGEAAASFRNREPDFAEAAFQKHCLEILRGRADEETRRTAERIFLATALSQNGRLDALIVFASLCRLVWRIAGIYSQRPHPGEIAALYWAVASSAFLALSLEELDITTEIGVGFGEAFHAAAPATMTSGLPFVGAALHKFTSSAIDGTANCYLALRTGIIARNAYAYALEGDKRPGRAAVFREAGGILLEMSGSLLEQMSEGLKGALRGLTRAAGGKAADAGRSMADGALRAGAEIAEGAGRLVSGTAHAARAGGESLTRAGKNAGSALGSAAVKIGRAAAGKVGISEKNGAAGRASKPPK